MAAAEAHGGEDFFSGSESSDCGSDDDCENSEGGQTVHSTVTVNQEFDTFEQLQSVAARCCRCKLSHNPRKEAAAVARQWLKDLLPDLNQYHTSGTLS